MNFNKTEIDDSKSKIIDNNPELSTTQTTLTSKLDANQSNRGNMNFK